MKNIERVRELSFGYLEDGLSEAEVKELENFLRNDEEARRTFIKEVEFETLLRMHFEDQASGGEESFSKKVMARLHAGDNRRHGDRYRLSHPEVKVKYKTRSDGTSLGVPYNVSESGVCFAATTNMNRDETVEVLVSFDQSGKPFRKKGKVVWAEKENKDAPPEHRTWKVGCRFLPEDDWEFQTALSKQASDPDSCADCSYP